MTMATIPKPRVTLPMAYIRQTNHVDGRIFKYVQQLQYDRCLKRILFGRIMCRTRSVRTRFVCLFICFFVCVVSSHCSSSLFVIFVDCHFVICVCDSLSVCKQSYRNC